MLLYAHSHIGNRLLGRDADDLRQSVRRGGLDYHCRGSGKRNGNEQVATMLRQHVVDQPLRASGKDQPRKSVDEHQRKSKSQRRPMTPDELARFCPGALVVDSLLL